MVADPGRRGNVKNAPSDSLCRVLLGLLRAKLWITSA